MKKICCFFICFVICFVLCSCGFNGLPLLLPKDKEIFEYEELQWIYGKITEKVSSKAVVLTVESQWWIEEWGEKVYVISGDAAEYCEGDTITVYFKELERPIDATKYVRIYAKQVAKSIPVAKPIIYLYPETPTVCSVNIETKGEFTCTYPQYKANGWENFTAYPNGNLIFPDGKEYYALFWEGIKDVEWDFSKGFCVPGDDTEQFLEWALLEQGLSQREANEFIIYWLPLMQDNAYNVISFQSKNYTDAFSLNINPAPDSVLRVFMAYYPSETMMEIPEQSFEKFVREGFTVVEWGGAKQ